MAWPRFEQNDFDVFHVEGLDQRMNALIASIRPKLHTYGSEIAPIWSELTKEPMYAHVAKHARRTVNPPNDTWVAWACNPRGYKALPHLQLGMWESHLFLQLAVIYECPTKSKIGQALTSSFSEINKKIPATYKWSDNHMQPQAFTHADLQTEDFTRMFTRLQTVKNSELLLGIHVARHDQILNDDSAWKDLITNTLVTLAPIYRLIANA